jgi:hypothetical protein
LNLFPFTKFSQDIKNFLLYLIHVVHVCRACDFFHIAGGFAGVFGFDAGGFRGGVRLRCHGDNLLWFVLFPLFSRFEAQKKERRDVQNLTKGTGGRPCGTPHPGAKHEDRLSLSCCVAENWTLTGALRLWSLGFEAHWR